MNDKYEEISANDAEAFKKELSFLLVTATDVESKKAHKRLKPLPGRDAILIAYKSNFTYYLGTFGSYGIVHVQSEMGAMSRGASLATVIQAIEHWSPSAVIMVGIAFGVDQNKQNIGDVLVSNSIIPYDNKRVGEKETIYRSPIPQSGVVLFNRFKEHKGWDHLLPSGEKAKSFDGPLLTGETLIDNIDYKNELIKQFPSAIGGEMEGTGLYAAASQKKVEWIILKGVCDFADGKKTENKDEFQNIAADSALSLCESIFLSRYAFDELGAKIIDRNSSCWRQQIKSENINKVLFDVYDESCEEYYIERDVDNLVKKNITYNSIWVSGDCGSGKTTLILRNLIHEGKDFIFIDLAKCVGESNELLLYNIYLDLYDKLETTSKLNKFSGNSSKIIRDIVSTIKSKYTNKELIINIDEIPISDKSIFEDFFSKIIAIQISLSHISNKNDVKIIASSIYNPQSNINNFQKKIQEKIKFLNIEFWIEKEIVELLTLIVSKLNLDLSDSQKQVIVEKSNGSPRFVKKIIRNFITCQKKGYDFDKIINDTLTEIN